ncbi:hypothetical protein KKF55_01065 [Patescibacteria group bacterium]|nr:hypothetical protein [Patescibacteria group bacterium]
MKRSFIAAIAALSILAPTLAGAAPAYTYYSAAFLPSSLYVEILTVAKGGASARLRRNNLMAIGVRQTEAKAIEAIPAEQETRIAEEPSQEPITQPPEVTAKERFKNRVCARILEQFTSHPLNLESTNRRLFSRFGFTCEAQ